MIKQQIPHPVSPEQKRFTKTFFNNIFNDINIEGKTILFVGQLLTPHTQSETIQSHTFCYHMQSSLPPQALHKYKKHLNVETDHQS